MVFPAGLLSRRLSGANPAVRTALEERIRELERAAPPDLVDELRRIVRAEVLKKRPVAHEVAERFSVDRRTLARHLHALGTGYKTVADQVRFEVAQQLLAELRSPWCRSPRRWTSPSPQPSPTPLRSGRVSPPAFGVPATGRANPEHLRAAQNGLADWPWPACV